MMTVKNVTLKRSLYLLYGKQVSALQDESAQDSAVRAVIRMCQCEAHETIQDMNSPAGPADRSEDNDVGI